MKTVSRIICTTVLFTSLLVFSVQASVPGTINYQGYLKNTDGTPVNTAVNVTFSLYSSNPARNNPVWRDTRSITPANGVYSVVLGQAKPINALFDAPYWLGVQVGADPEMTPLQALAASPYAFRAATADSVGSGALADGSVTDAKIGGTIGDDKLSGNVALLDNIQTFSGVKTFSAPLASTVPTGMAPFAVASTTEVANLNAEKVGGKNLADLDLRYASITIQAPPVQNPRENTIVTLDNKGDVGQYSSITIGSDGLPVISYYDITNSDLKVAHCGNATCSSGNDTVSLDYKVEDTGRYTSITIGTDGLPVISYYDATNRDLKVAKCGNATCSSFNSIATLDSPGDVGSWYTSITIGRDGLPVISYYDGTNRDLKVIHCGNADCSNASGNTSATLESAGYLGKFSSITIGMDGLPVISYTETSLENFLKVIHCGNAACSSGNTITNFSGSGNAEYTSITIGTDGLPVISYYDATNRDLKVAKCGNATCSSRNSIVTLDSTGDVGPYTSITIGTDGLPVISYYDISNGDLKVAKCANQFCLSNWSRR